MLLSNKSRSVDRIEPIIKKLEETWRLYPDFRLGQLIVNCAGTNNIAGIEDDVMLERIEAFCESLRRAGCDKNE